MLFGSSKTIRFCRGKSNKPILVSSEEHLFIVEVTFLIVSLCELMKIFVLDICAEYSGADLKSLTNDRGFSSSDSNGVSTSNVKPRSAFNI